MWAWYYGDRGRLGEIESSVLEESVVEWILAHAKVEDIPDEKPLSEKPLDTAMESHPMSSLKAGAPRRVVEKKGSHKKNTAQGRRRSGDTGEVDQKIDNLIEVQYPLAPISK